MRLLWSKIRDELSCPPEVPFDEGPAATVGWYAGNRSWWEPLKHDNVVAR